MKSMFGVALEHASADERSVRPFSVLSRSIASFVKDIYTVAVACYEAHAAFKLVAEAVGVLEDMERRLSIAAEAEIVDSVQVTADDAIRCYRYLITTRLGHIPALKAMMSIRLHLLTQWVNIEPGDRRWLSGRSI